MKRNLSLKYTRKSNNSLKLTYRLKVVPVQFLRWRVWSWLRMNAGGAPNTCKSSEKVPSGMSTAADGWVTRENLPFSEEYPREIEANTAYVPSGRKAAYLAVAKGWACGLSACWWGKSPPRLWRVAGLRGCSARLELRYGPDSYGRQQWGVLRNGRKPDAATPRGGWRFSDCKLLLFGKKKAMAT